MVGLGIAVFLMALDMSILTTAIPLITEKFQSTEDIGWYVSAYTLSLCALQPLSGKLYANFSLKVCMRPNLKQPLHLEEVSSLFHSLFSS